MLYCVIVRHVRYPSVYASLLVLIIAASGCTLLPYGKNASARTSPENSNSIESQHRSRSLVVNFAGDIMAHVENYTMNDYTRIYDDVRPLLHEADLNFGNLEIPVDDALPMSTYPSFNTHTPYVAAAIEAGFNVLSLANNHSNDKGSGGIDATQTVMKSLAPGVYSSGLRVNPDEKMQPVIIHKNGWTILFLSVTEILNSYDQAGKRVYYVAHTEPERAQFLVALSRMREENPCDLFVLSIHLNEPEYVREISAEKRNWFKSIADAGVDIVWGNHPHVMQKWELSTARAGKNERPVLFMYSMGNFISGQRSQPDLENPGGFREYTGDGVILRVTVSGRSVLDSSVQGAGFSGYSKLSYSPLAITNYVDPVNGIVVRRFNKKFIDSLPVQLQKYYNKRYDLMKSYLPLLPPAAGTDILK